MLTATTAVLLLLLLLLLQGVTKATHC